MQNLHQIPKQTNIRLPTLQSWQNSQPFPKLFQTKITISPTNFTHILCSLPNIFIKFKTNNLCHVQIVIKSIFFKYFYISQSLNIIQNHQSKFPNFSRPGTPKWNSHLFPKFRPHGNPDISTGNKTW